MIIADRFWKSQNDTSASFYFFMRRFLRSSPTIPSIAPHKAPKRPKIVKNGMRVTNGADPVYPDAINANDNTNPYTIPDSNASFLLRAIHPTKSPRIPHGIRLIPDPTKIKREFITPSNAPKIPTIKNLIKIL